jgi:hypothetical protein
MFETLHKIGLIITMATVLALVSAHAVLADSCSMGRTPEGVYPINDASVTMVNEDVKVIIAGDGSTAAVDCHFTFKNSGAARRVLMGFPAYGLNQEEGLTSHDLDAAKLQDFWSYADGSAVDVQETRAIAPPGTAPDANFFYSWYTFTVPFAAGETREVRNTYTVTLVEGNEGYFAGYILRTGRFWQGPIGHARITFEMGQIPPYQISRLDPYCYRFQGNDLVFEQSNFKPDYDLTVAFYGSDGSNMTKEYIAYFKTLLSKLPAMNRDQLLQVYNRAVQDQYPVLAAYIRSMIPGYTVSSVPPSIEQLAVVPWPEQRCNKVSFQVSESSGDLTFMTLKVSHRVNGQEVIDQEDQQPVGSCGYNYDTGVFGNPYRVADYFTFNELPPGREYQVEVSVRNVTGQSDSKVVSFSPEPDSLKSNNNTVSVPAALTSTVKTVPDYFVLSITALVLLYFIIFFIYRIKRR